MKYYLETRRTKTKNLKSTRIKKKKTYPKLLESKVNFFLIKIKKWLLTKIWGEILNKCNRWFHMTRVWLKE